MPNDREAVRANAKALDFQLLGAAQPRENSPQLRLRAAADWSESNGLSEDHSEFGIPEDYPCPADRRTVPRLAAFTGARRSVGFKVVLRLSHVATYRASAPAT
jgi:hypothetical protein